MNQPTPAGRTHTRIAGITVAIVGLLVVGSAGAALATGIIPSPFTAPEIPVTTSTPSPLITPTTTPTATSPAKPTMHPVDDPSDPTTWAIGFDHVGPAQLGMSPDELVATVPSLTPTDPGSFCLWRDFGTTSPLQSIRWEGPQGSDAGPVSLLIVDGLSVQGSTNSLRTDRGIGSGSSPADVKAAYPDVVTVENYRGNIILSATDQSGNVLQFWIDPNTNSVASIHVVAAGFNPGTFACD
ncbi:hypothetical protein [Subtercola frigoramans]|uniref:Uncharacterized protein n=1 Tax=Subtercola frigoramans TaxID=120298 RepID=A0ABS2L773_9MICO|nr:hypothetical protein [Subtercola frigoramans]MBM7472321.1 hypothetical protein [Subtercola frigoramans]